MYNNSDYSRQLEILGKMFDGSSANLAAKTNAANWIKRYALPVHLKFSKNINPAIAKFHESELDKIYATLDFWEAELKQIFAK